MRLLPGKVLEEAQNTVSAEKHTIVRLRITGVISQYKNRRYLLLRKALRERELGQF